MDNVNHPSHYTSHPSGVECIQITRHMIFSIGNAIKYLWRAGLKGNTIELSEKEYKSLTPYQKHKYRVARKKSKLKEIEDLKKASFYINDRIKQLENEL